MGYKNFTIIRGSTPTINIKFDVADVEAITKTFLVIKQCDIPILSLDERRMEKDIENKILSFTLTQTETLKLDSLKLATISCDWLCSTGSRGRSREISCRVADPAMEGVMDNE